MYDHPYLDTYLEEDMETFLELLPGSGLVFYLLWVICATNGGGGRTQRGETRELLKKTTGQRHLFLLWFGSERRIKRLLYEVHPRSLEIREHEAMLNTLKRVPGKKAASETKVLRRALADLYATPQRIGEIDGDAYMEYIKPQLAVLHELRSEADATFFEFRERKLAELV